MQRFYILSILFFLTAQNSFSQKKIVLTVTDANSVIIPQAQISNAVNTALGVTDNFGKLSLMYDSVLQINVTANGYKTGTFFITSANDTSIILQQKNTVINEETVYVFGRKTTTTNSAAAVSVLSSAAFQKYDQPSFVAAFNTVPGAKMDERSPGSYRINIRGNLLRSTFGVRNIKIYLNGLPITDASGNTYFNAIAPALINKMDVIKGPGGSMYGAGTGGVLLMSNASYKNQQADVQITAGSYGLFTAAANANFNTSKTNSYVSLSHQQSNGYRNHSAMQRDVLGYTGSIHTAPSNTITLTSYFSKLFYETPGGLTLAQVAANPKQERPATALFKSAEAQKAAFYLSTVYAGVANEKIINKALKNTTGAYFSYTDFKNPTIRNYEKKYEKGAGVRSFFEYEQQQLQASAGAEYQYSFINTATHGNRLGVKDTLQYYDRINVQQLNVFAQAGYTFLKNYTVTTGLSFNSFTYNFKRIYPFETPAAATFKPQYIPRISLQKKLKAGSIYTSVSKGYSPPTIDEIHAGNGIFNSSLKAEDNLSYEAGFKLNLFKNMLYTEAALYTQKLNNTIVGRKDASGGDFFVNAGNTTQQGIEFALIYVPVLMPDKLIQSVKIQTNGTAVKARFKDYKQGAVTYSGNTLTGTAPFTFSAMADVVTSAKIYSNITYTYTDKIALNDANSFYAKAYNLLFVKLGLKKMIAKKTTADVYVAAMKSFNKNYSLGNDLNADANRFFNPSALQTFTVGLKVSFSKQ